MRHGQARVSRRGSRSTGASRASPSRGSRRGPRRRSGGRGKKGGPYPILAKLDAALTPDWHGDRAAGRVERHLEILRLVAHEISSRPDRADPPADASEAKAGLDDLLKELQAEAPRFGLGAATGAFVDHVAGVAARYGEFIFTCFDYPLLPSDTNELEGYFGSSKSQLRSALGTSSTAGSVAKNLGGDYLEAFATARRLSGEALFEQIDAGSDADFAGAREAVRTAERPATLRRSRRRAPQRHLDDLLTRWLASP